MAYNWDTKKSNLSIIKIGNETYYVKDAEARAAIDSITATVGGVMHWRGISSTDPTTGTITIDGDVLNAEAGDVVGYNSVAAGTQLEYAYNGTTWEEFGSTGALKAMAFADTGTVTFTPSVTKGTLAVDQGTVSGSGEVSTIDSIAYESFSAPTAAPITAGASSEFVTGIDNAVKAEANAATETLTLTVATPTKGTANEVKTIESAVVTAVSLGNPTITRTNKTVNVTGTTAGVALTGEVSATEQTETVNPVTGA